MRSSNSLA